MPHRFQVSLPSGDCEFNRIVSLDIMSLDGQTILNAVDRDTKFEAACFLEGESSAVVWKDLLSIWVAPYIGFPNIFALDQEPQFSSTEWFNSVQKAGIKI